MEDNPHNLHMTREAIVAMLREHGINPTSQRIDVAQLLFARPQHLSAEQVMHAVRQAGHVISKATIYNTLGLFASKGLVREVNVDSSRVFYDSNTGKHHHFYNVDTGELTDIDDLALQVTDLPEVPAGTRMEGVEVIVRVRESRD
jgi:Fur family iron response transcriptional regulator